MTKLHKATILSHTPAGRGYHRLVLKALGASVAALPGQFVMLRVSDNFDPFLARPFGIASLPSKSSIEILYRVVGRGSALLTLRSVGETLSLLGPFGTGFLLPDRNVTPLLVAGGSGFPPLLFLSGRIGARAHVFVGAKNRECLPPPVVLRRFKEHAFKVHLATEDGSAGRQGLSTDVLKVFLKKKEHTAPLVLYSCGPHAMLAEVSRIAEEHSITCYISAEERMACGVGACMGCSIPMRSGGYKRVCKEGPVFDSREIDWGK